MSLTHSSWSPYSSSLENELWNKRLFWNMSSIFPSGLCPWNILNFYHQTLSAICYIPVQVFSVLESTYQHDSLRYLLDYFVPAKHLLHKLQQHACVSFYTTSVHVKNFFWSKQLGTLKVHTCFFIATWSLRYSEVTHNVPFNKPILFVTYTFVWGWQYLRHQKLSALMFN